MTATMSLIAESEYIDAKELTAIVPGTTTSYWAQLRYQGTGPKFLKPSPRKVLYRRADVIEWLEASERTTTDRNAR